MFISFMSLRVFFIFFAWFCTDFVSHICTRESLTLFCVQFMAIGLHSTKSPFAQTFDWTHSFSNESMHCLSNWQRKSNVKLSIFSILTINTNNMFVSFDFHFFFRGRVQVYAIKIVSEHIKSQVKYPKQNWIEEEDIEKEQEENDHFLSWSNLYIKSKLQ